MPQGDSSSSWWRGALKRLEQGIRKGFNMLVQAVTSGRSLWCAAGGPPSISLKKRDLSVTLGSFSVLVVYLSVELWIISFM
jgi:hypothetical protein